MQNDEDGNDPGCGIPDSAAPESPTETIPATHEEQMALDAILRLFLKSAQVDFSHYRRTTILRRLARRISLSGMKSYAGYLGLLEQDPKEVELLYNDLLLSVTEFFRDPPVFDLLKEKVFPGLLERRPAKTPIRIWVAGCSTGEEVYSLAISIHEYLKETKSHATAQIFGTDLNHRHITTARAALYQEKIRKNLSAERIGSYFEQTTEGLRVTKQIREMCVFAVQDITRDPPFSSIDLISCRNVLIYLDEAFQDIVIPLFHFALKPHGYLLLGSSESMGKFGDIFAPVNQVGNLYSKRSSQRKPLLKFPGGQRLMPIPISTRQPTESSDMTEKIDDVLLDCFAPPCILVDRSMRILQFRGDTSPFLSPAAGEASLKLSKMTSEGLMPDIYVAIQEAKEKKERVRKKNVTFTKQNAVVTIDLGVVPVPEISGETCFLITFEKSQNPDMPQVNSAGPPEPATGEQQLRLELQSAKEHLQSIIEEKDTVNQELWAANEEIQSSNEELQSVNEEMEAAKEELESSNEELKVLNEEMRVKNIELMEAKDFSETLIDTAQVIILMLDMEGRVVRFNQYMEEISGYSLAEVQGKNWFDTFLPSKDRDTVFSLFRKAANSIPTKGNVNPIVTKEGKEIEIEWYDKILKDSGGSAIGLLAVGLDVSERRIAEENLRRSEEKFRNLFNNAEVGMFRTRLDGSGILDFNEKYLEIFGCTREEMQGNPSVVHWADSSERVAMVRMLEAGGSVTNFSCRMLDKKGRVRHCLTSVRLYKDQGILEGSIIDISEIRLAEMERARVAEALRESEYFFKESQRAAFIGSYKTDFVAGFWESSEVLDQIFGIGRDYIRSVEGWLDIVHPDDREMMNRYLVEEVVAARRPFNKKYRIIRKSDGEPRWVHGLGKAHFDADGKILSMIGTIQDITESKKIETMLQNAQKLDSLGILAGGIAHDFNNLMGGIFGYIDLANEATADPRVSSYLGKAVLTIDRARSLTRQLLTFAKGGVPIQRIECLFPYLQDVVHFALSGSNVSCSFDIAGNLWLCNFDRSQIGQVIDNIVINAQQAMPGGGIVEVRAGNVVFKEREHPALKAGDYVRISVVDTGTGIPKEILPRIFDPFFTTKAQGHGLGLATCFSIVNRHGGCIDVESEPGKGSTFQLYLPAVKDARPSSAEHARVDHRGSGTILVMDDEEMMRETVGDMLEALGYSVVYRSDGREAVEFFFEELEASRPVAALILDLTVPGGTGGREAVAMLRKVSGDVPVFVASGYPDDPVMKNPADYGFTDSICKPYRKNDLAQMLEKHLKNG